MAMMRAAYFGVLADPADGNPTVRSVQAMVFRMYARKFHNAEVATFLKSFRSDSVTLREQAGTGLVTSAPRKTGALVTGREQVGTTRGRVVKVLDLQESLLPDAPAPAVEHTPPAMPDGLPTDFPPDVNALKRLTIPFLAAFANVKSDEAIRKHGPAYADVLATFRSRGVSVAQAWSAFADALAAHSGKPLFKNLANTSLRYLPARPTGQQRFERPAGPAVETIPKSERR